MDFIIRDRNYFKQNILHRIADSLDKEIDDYMIDIISGSKKIDGLDVKPIRQQLFYENRDQIINDTISVLELRIKELEEENQKLYQKNMFKLSDTQEEKLTRWKETHNCKNRNKSHGAIGGQYKYTFVPTSIGAFCSVKCSCGAEIDLSNEV